MLPTLPDESMRLPIAAGLAALVLGAFLGNWVIGPVVSYETSDRREIRSGKEERAWIDKVSAQPPPSPYRTPTPNLEAGNAPAYGALAKAQAQAALGRRSAGSGAADDGLTGFSDDARAAFATPAPTAESRYPQFDRHKVY